MDAAHDTWANLQAGLNCYLCAPREANKDYRLEIAQLSTSTLYLFRDQRFRGYCLLIFDPRHATALDELSDSEYRAYMYDLRVSASAMRAALHPDHVNFECLGNSNPHLHWHIVPRYKNDSRWGQPIWEGWQPNEFNLHRVTLTETEYTETITRIRRCLAARTEA
jgi:diadenosine tetraphosphate (Ap4A) HIT family hydrolase